MSLPVEMFLGHRAGLIHEGDKCSLGRVPLALETSMYSRLVLSAVVFAVTLCAPSARSADSVKLLNKDAFKGFLLIGQSNMAGRGKPFEELDKTDLPRVLLSNNDARRSRPSDRLPIAEVMLSMIINRSLSR